MCRWGRTSTENRPRCQANQNRRSLRRLWHKGHICNIDHSQTRQMPRDFSTLGIFVKAASYPQCIMDYVRKIEITRAGIIHTRASFIICTLRQLVIHNCNMDYVCRIEFARAESHIRAFSVHLYIVPSPFIIPPLQWHVHTVDFRTLTLIAAYYLYSKKKARSINASCLRCLLLF